MKNFKQANSQGGFTLIELLLVLAIIAALAIAAFVVYPRVQAGRNATYETQVLSSAQAGVKALFTTNNYHNISTDVAFNSELFPKTMNGDTAGEIKNQWDGAVTVAPSTSNGDDPSGTTIDRFFKIDYDSVPTDVCIRLAGAAVQNFGTVLINDVIVQNTYSDPQVDLDESLIAENCKADTAVKMTFVSN